MPGLDGLRIGGGGGPIDLPGVAAAGAGSGALEAFGALPGRGACRGGGFGESVKRAPRASGEYATARDCARTEHYKEISESA